MQAVRIPGRKKPSGTTKPDRDGAPADVPQRGNDTAVASSDATPDRHDHDRKHHVLSQPRASTAASIADAVVGKDGEPFFLCQPDGQVPLATDHGYGFYHHDCRFLAGYEITIAGQRPEPLAATERDGTALVLEVTNGVDERDGIAKNQLGVRWTRRVDDAGPSLHDELTIRNFGRDPVEVPIVAKFRATFEDVFTIRGLLTDRRGDVHDPAWEDGHLVIRYDGVDGVDRAVRIGVSPAPDGDGLDRDGASIRVRIEPRHEATVRIEIELEEHVRPGVTPIEQRASPPDRPRNDAKKPRRPAQETEVGDEWIGDGNWDLRLRTSSFALDAVMRRSLADLVLLRGELDGFRYYEAGIPWFATLFGRDSLITAIETLSFAPALAAETVRLLARRQGTCVDEWRDEQPGKILHELRIGELARIGEIPHTPYFGTIDATPLFLIAVGAHARWTGSLDLFDELKPQIDAALEWIDRDGDTDGDGFIDYRSRTNRGLANQGWKDSGDAIVDADGRLAEPPIALAEVQGYVWRAWTEMADLFDRSGDATRAAALRQNADGLRDRFEDRFWSDELGCYVLALGNGRPCEVPTSNAGQVLWSGIASPERGEAVAKRLLEPDLFGGWGIRTLSTDARAYHPIGYHIGTVWPHDNALIGTGFRRYRLDDQAETIFLGLLEAARTFPQDRLPECFAGFARSDVDVPVRYPIACHPQAWAAGAIPLLLTSVLGLEADGFTNRLVVRRPRLPEGIELVELHDVPVGRGRASLRFDRHHDGTTYEVIETSGDVEVVSDEARPDA